MKIGWGTNFFMKYWSFAENFGPREGQYSMKNWPIVGPRFSALDQFSTKFWSKILRKIGPKLKTLLKTGANSAKPSAFSDSVTSIYPKQSKIPCLLKKNNFCWPVLWENSKCTQHLLILNYKTGSFPIYSVFLDYSKYTQVFCIIYSRLRLIGSLGREQSHKNSIDSLRLIGPTPKLRLSGQNALEPK